MSQHHMAVYTAAKSQAEFITTPEDLRETLQKYGVAILPPVLNEQEIQQMQEGYWQLLEQMSKKCPLPTIQKNKRKSWDTFYHAFKPLRGMLMQHWGVGQAQVLWDLRQNPKIVDIFATLWGVSSREDLLVSFDGTSFAFPTSKGVYDGTDKFHIDQAPNNPEFRCVQSWVTAYDVNPGDATLSVLEGSHIMLGDFCKAFGKQRVNRDFYILSPEEVRWYKDSGCGMRDITCPAGSMVFWDSRAVHYGKGSLPNRPKRNFRAVAYLCYTPKSFATPQAMAHKQNAFFQGNTTNHCPHNPGNFTDTPRYCNKSIKPEHVRIPPPVLTPLGRSLAGLEPVVSEAAEEEEEQQPGNNTTAATRTSSPTGTGPATHQDPKKESTSCQEASATGCVSNSKSIKKLQEYRN